MLDLDTTTDFGARAARRLQTEQIIWLVTAGADGTPQPSPVWFHWDGATMLIFSEPDAPKIRNIARNPRVAVHFDSDGWGGNIVVLTGEARVLDNAPSVEEVPDYLEKYAEGIERIGMTPEQMAATYSTAIRVTPGRVRGH